mmetsp:Transcript_15847/g.38891  ORF Transcript_15847/g.38891 Transcript_15847/m.38891 type:complete len:209 (-) Transcript_15847:221-847(-)
MFYCPTNDPSFRFIGIGCHGGDAHDDAVQGTNAPCISLVFGTVSQSRSLRCHFKKMPHVNIHVDIIMIDQLVRIILGIRVGLHVFYKAFQEFVWIISIDLAGILLGNVPHDQASDTGIDRILSLFQRSVIMDPCVFGNPNVVSMSVPSGLNFFLGELLGFSGQGIASVESSLVVHDINGSRIAHSLDHRFRMCCLGSHHFGDLSVIRP